MKKIIGVLFLLSCTFSPALADSLVVQNCGTLPLAYAPGTTRPDTIDVNGIKCSDAVVNTNPSVPGYFAFSPTSGVVYSSTPSLSSFKVVKNSPGSLYSFQVSADNTLAASDWWVMIFDATSEPADGAVQPVKSYHMPATATFYSAGFPSPLPFGTGITIVVSTTGPFTKTASSHAFISGDVQ